MEGWRLFLEALQEGGLVGGADIVMSFVAASVVFISIEIICEEAKRLHVEHEFAGIDEGSFFGGCQYVG